MTRNMANLDRLIRIIIAVLVIIFYLYGQISGTAAIVLGLIAAIFIATSFSGYCPLYHILGISTKKNKN
jgi:Na+(H+)/acetate symporter ActP